MNTFFHILWFEDDNDWREASEPYINEKLTPFNLNAKIDKYIGNDFHIEQIGGKNEIDLILMDFNLSHGVHGDELINQIRECNILADILFYSADYPGMLDKIKQRIEHFSGIYLSDRDESFEDILNKLICKVIRRSQDTVNLRGILMDKTSEFENRMKEIFINAKTMLDDSSNTNLNTYLVKLLVEGKKNTVSHYDEILYQTGQPNNDNNPSEENNQCKFDDSMLLKKTIESKGYIFDNRKQTRYFDKLLKQLKSKNIIPSSIFESYSPLSEKYKANIQDYRNALAHLKIGENVIFISDKKIQINQELFNKINGNLHEFDKFLNSIESIIKGNYTKQ